MTRIIGIDPGLRFTGWAIIDIECQRYRYIDSGIITTQSTDSLAQRLCQIYRGLSEVMTQYEPKEAAVEEIFVNRDAKDTLKLGQARAISLLVPALKGLIVAEYAANTIKKSLTGVGHADKEQVAFMVKMLLPLAGPHKKDATDALAAALTHAHMRHTSSLIKG